MSSDIRKDLQAAWVHSYEDDAGDRLVFKGPDADFKPSRRPREAFTLKAGGVAEVAVPGPDDRRQRAEGSWKLSGKRLKIDAPGFSGTFEVESVDDQRLVVRRVEQET